MATMNGTKTEMGTLMNCLTAPGRGLRVLILTAFLLVTLVAGSAFAATATIRADGVIAAGGWTGVSAANLGDNSDASFASRTGVTDTFTVSLQNDAAYAGATISDVTLFLRARVLSGGGAGEKFTIGQNGGSTSAAITAIDNTFTEHSFSLGGGQTDAQVDAIDVDVAITTIGAGETIEVADVWAVVTYTAGGPANTLTSCADCHDYPPADETGGRGVPEGAVVGDHTVHNAYTCNFCHVVPATETSADFNHRDGDINMKAATIGDAASGDNGSYSRGATFAQSNAPTTGTCSNVDCHSNNVTPQWGVGTTDCTSCHDAPPATNAHAAHYTAKGWTSPDTAGANCSSCHPGDHDGVVEVNAGLSYAANSCSAPGGLGCHNDYATPDWTVGGAVCGDCHTAGGLNGADPVSGLHDETPTVSGVIHNPSDANFTNCETCHTANPSASHWDGTLDTPSTFAAGVGYNGVPSPSTCTASTCHSDGGFWERKWHENSDLSDGSECAGCHGTFATEFTTGVSSRHQTTTSGDADGQVASSHDGTDQCYTCHTYKNGDSTYYTWGTQHMDGNIQINNQVTFTDNGATVGCSGCHSSNDGTADEGHEFTDTTSRWTRVTQNGPAAACDSCHGGGGDYYPTAGASWPQRPGRHLKHMTELATKIGYGAYPWTDAEQKHMCEYCHNDAGGVGGGGHSSDGGADSTADIGDFNPIWDSANPPVTADAGSAYAADGCNSIDCHNGKATGTTTYGWYDAGTTSCTMCHEGGTTDPTSGLHDVVPTVSSVQHNPVDANFASCETCHTASPSATHIDGTADTPSVFDAAVGYSAGATPTCTASACHSDGGAWQRKWHENSTAAVGPTSNACAGCHGTFTTGFNDGVSNRHPTTANPDPGGEIQANHDGTDTCVTCHAYDGADTYGHKWVTHHLDNKIQISDQANFVTNAGTVGCGACHSNNDGTADGQHEFVDASAANGWSTVSRLVAGPSASCNSCHDSGGGGAPVVSAASTHVDADGGGGTYTAGTCTDCHNGHANGTTGVNDVEIDTDVPILTAGTYSSHAGGAIQLGGDATAAYSVSTEAELCWNCHDDNAISEWGKTWGSYQTGNVNVSDWTSANWSSAIAAFSYKNGNIGTLGSVHGTAGMATKIVDGMTMRTGEVPADISCTYCHDVHMVKKTVGAYDPVATPYLRGNWTSNVYTNDGAPMATHDGSWGAGDARGSVPRAAALLNTAGNNEEGGWQIEQNNGRNDSAQTYANYGGICQNCHTEAGIKGGWGPHGAVVAGFTGSANDIFDNSYRGGGGTWDHGHIVNAGTTDARGQAAGKSNYIGALRNSNQWSDGISPPAGKPQYSPLMQPAFTAGAVTSLTTSGNVAQSNFHNFMCSKCHQPHASRLPRLMITNCLDVNHNQWDNGYNPAGWGAFAAAELAYSPTAGNCHRYVDTSDGKGESGSEAGWNTVTPWDDATGLPFN